MTILAPTLEKSLTPCNILILPLIIRLRQKWYLSNIYSTPCVDTFKTTTNASMVFMNYHAWLNMHRRTTCSSLTDVQEEDHWPVTCNIKGVNNSHEHGHSAVELGWISQPGQMIVIQLISFSPGQFSWPPFVKLLDACTNLLLLPTFPCKRAPTTKFATSAVIFGF